MLDVEFVKQLKEIAYSDAAKPSDRHQAFATLYKVGYDPGEILKHLELLAKDTTIPDKYKIRIITLISAIAKDIGHVNEQTEVDEINIKNALMEQYCGQT